METVISELPSVGFRSPHTLALCGGFTELYINQRHTDFCTPVEVTVHIGAA